MCKSLKPCEWMYSDYPQRCRIVADPVPSATGLFECSLPDDHSYVVQISCLSFVYHSIMYCRNICFSLVVQDCFSDAYERKICAHMIVVNPWLSVPCTDSDCSSAAPMIGC